MVQHTAHAMWQASREARAAAADAAMRALHAEQVEKHERMSNPLTGLKRVCPPRQMAW